MRVGTGLGLGVSSAEGRLCCSPQAQSSIESKYQREKDSRELDSHCGSPELETHKEMTVLSCPTSLPRLKATPRTSRYFPPYIPGREGCRARGQDTDCDSF